MTEETRQQRCASRRGVLMGAGLAGIGGAVAGCSMAAVPFDATDGGTIPHDEQVPTPSDAPNGQTIPVQVASTADIPVGGGMVILKDNIVVTQPVTGEFKAFSVVCPHVGCLLDKVANGAIECPCHGSSFRISDGSVLTGPATTSLTPVRITVADGAITIT
jgi:nitrite reductase/ring-hydroxylating ferredoxin subunit